jgi:hypothetical protein
MTEWIKAGVCGDLQKKTQKCKGRIIKLYESRGRDFFLTAVRDGNHAPGSFHGIGCAFDFRRDSLISDNEIKEAAGKGFDVVFHGTHVHVEYDPK